MAIFITNSKIPWVSKHIVFHSAINATSEPLSHYWAFLPPSLRRLIFCVLCFPPKCYCNRLSKTGHSRWNSAFLCDMMLQLSVPDIRRRVPIGYS